MTSPTRPPLIGSADSDYTNPFFPVLNHQNTQTIKDENELINHHFSPFLGKQDTLRLRETEIHRDFKLVEKIRDEFV